MAVLGVVILITAAPALAADRDRDWSGVELAWQNDPRAIADTPLTVEPTRRPSRRAQRRGVRRPVSETSPARPTGPAGDAVAIELEPATGRATPPDSLAGVVVHRDQPYGDESHPRQRIDLHLPDGCSGGGMPLVVWIHGPDWRTGSKADCPVAWLAGRGYAVASIGYRTSDVATYPAQLDDCRAAVETLAADAVTWGIDARRICVVGEAAGGHLAALVGFEPAADGLVREASIEAGGQAAVVPAAVAIVAAPAHLTTLGGQHDRPGSPASRLVGGPLPEFREAAQRASPLVHVSADDPPTLIVHARRDPEVPADQAVRLDRALQAAGVDSTLVLVDAPPRMPLDERSAAGVALLEFLDRVIVPGPPRPAAE